MSGVGPRTREVYQGEAPANYVAGLGRGAVGFTTRSDIGPARAAPPPVQDVPGATGMGPPPGYVAGGGRGMGGVNIEPPAPTGMGRGSGTAGLGGFGAERDENEDYGDYSETNYDEFSGYTGGGLFNDTPYDQDDQEADDIYSSIDERMDSRRKRRREMKLLEDMKKARKERPKISDQFADLKTNLKSVSNEEWNNIPDIGDYSLKYKQNRRAEVFTPLPDKLIDDNRQSRAAVNILDAKDQFGGLDTPLNGASSSIKGFAQAREAVLSLKLDKMSDSISGQTVVDPKGYLTDLNSLKITSDAEIGDIKKARLLLRSVITTNPQQASGWIAATRLEEVAGKLVQARKLIKQGCESCPKSEDVWLEAARLQSPDNAKTILANAVRNVPTSVKVWMQAANLEDDEESKKVVLRRALEFIPNSERLWKAVIEMEGPEEARILLGRAVECVSHSVDMWLALARLETYENAKKTLNKARRLIPTEPAIWITAAKLEEAHNHPDSVERIIKASIASLNSSQIVIDREQWLKEAEACERVESYLTCAAIVRNCLDIGVETEDRKRTWMDDAENATTRKSLHTAKAIYAHALKVFPKKKSIWMRAAALEREIGTPESVENLLQKAVECCPESEILWLMAAKEVWRNGNVDNSRAILRQAFSVNPNSENIWLAAVKLEWENDEFERARVLLDRARENAPTARVWMKSILLERELKESEAEETLLKEGLKRYPECDKLHMMMGQFYETAEKDDEARKKYREGVAQCPKSFPLWILFVTFEERVNGSAKARSLLELARLKNPKTPELWLEATRLEARASNPKGQHNLMAKALQDCPQSGILLAESIDIASRSDRRAVSLAALKKLDNDPHVCLAVARLFWNDRKHSKARKWFERSVQLNTDLGDGWGYYYLYESRHGNEAQKNAIYKRCVDAEPHHGEIWCKIAKQTNNRRLKTGKILELVSTLIAKKETKLE